MLNLVYIPRFIGHDYAPIDGVMAHLRHVVDLVGIDHVGIGGLGTDAEEMKMFKDAGWPYERLAQVLAERPSDINTSEQVDRMIDALMSAGFGDDDIRKIFGGNLLRILGAVLPEGEGGQS
jgi:membrane dipeptidase